LLEPGAGRLGAAVSAAGVEHRDVLGAGEQVGALASRRRAGGEPVRYHVEQQPEPARGALIRKPAQPGVGRVLPSQARVQPGEIRR
jgi:hypothetical protein